MSCKVCNWWNGAGNHPATGPIKHVVGLMFETHSFDQMLGCARSILEAAWKNDNTISPDEAHLLAVLCRI